MSQRKTVLLLCSLSITLYALACYFPAFVGREKTYQGFYCLLMGGFTILSILYKPLWFVAWTANLFYFLGLRAALSRRQSKRSDLGIAVLAVSLSLSSLGINSVLPDSSRMDVPALPSLGAYFWILAILLGFAANFIKRRNEVGPTL